MNKKLIILFSILALSLIFNAFLVYKLKKDNNSGQNQETEAQYKLIDPLQKETVDSNIQTDAALLHFSGLREQLDEEIEKYEASENVGLFVQDSRTGAWLGINERTNFIPASLLKIPIMMAILKKVEMEEIKLNDPIELKSEDLDPNSGTLYQKSAGFKISVWNLLEEMILASDNTAKNALKRQLSETELNTVFAHVGIPNPYLEPNGQRVTPRGYSRLFKSLYLSTFLSNKLSEKALEITTDTKMENLISARIPYQVQVAHKYGERPDGISDCGIIYHPKSTCFLCVMTKDMEIPKAKELIANLSKITYDFVSGK